MRTAFVLLTLVLACRVDCRRPRAASPQSRRALPGLQLPTPEDLVGSLVPSLWKYRQPYPDQRQPVQGEWTQGQKAGEWVWRQQGERRILKDIRRPPYFHKKPTGLEKKPLQKYPKKVAQKYPKKKFLGPKFQKGVRPPAKVRLTPVADLRPTSIDRIDILRPQLQPGARTPFVPSGAKTAPVNSPQLQNGRNTAPTTTTTTTTTSPPLEVDGIKIFMFRGDEGIGGHKETKLSYKPNQILPVAENKNKKILWSKAEIKPQEGWSKSQIKTQDPWSKAQIKTQEVQEPLQRAPNPVVSYTSRPSTKDIAPPFPTRHTTKAPNHENKPIVIIAQSNVAQN